VQLSHALDGCQAHQGVRKDRPLSQFEILLADGSTDAPPRTGGWDQYMYVHIFRVFCKIAHALPQRRASYEDSICILTDLTRAFGIKKAGCARQPARFELGK
jgi:hypothetical protein